MVQSIQRRAGLTGVGGSTHAFNARERRKSLKDPAAGLFVSHDFGVDNSNIATGNLFPDRHRPITFSFSVTRTGNSAAGIIAEFGSSANGFAVWVDDLHLGFAIGSSGLNGITIVTEDILKTIGERYNIVVSCIPNKGIACVWEGGKVVGSAFTPSRKMPNGWSDGENGALKQINGTVNSRVPVASRVSLTDVALASRFAVYNGQYPRQFVLHSNTQDGLCSGSSPALVHTDFMSSRFYTRTDGQVGVTSNDFADLLTFTGAPGREYIDANGDTVVVGLNEPRIGSYIDVGGLFNAGIRFNSGNGEAMKFNGGALARAIGSPGPELFSTDGTTDESSAGGTVTISGDSISVDNTTGTARATNDIIYEVGEKYLLEFVSSGAPMGVYHGGALALGTLQDGKNSYIFEAEADSNQIGFRNFAAGTTGVVSNVTLRKVTMPAAVSIAIEGYMTYADLDAFATVRLLDWRNGSDNRIAFELSTSGSDTGRMFFLSRAAGVNDTSETGIADKAPGTNVPYSYAARFTETVLRGSSDGTLASAEGQSSLLNLISSDFTICTNFNGNITSLTIWADGITDPRLQAATTEGSGFNPLCPL